MGLDDLLSKLESRIADTSNTPYNATGVSVKSSPNKACTPDPSDSSQDFCAEDWAEFNYLQSDPISDSGDRRTCTQCLNLRGRICCIAKPGGKVSANRGYTPLPDLPIRCLGYMPNADDHDQRPGSLRWPGLTTPINLPASETDS